MRRQLCRAARERQRPSDRRAGPHGELQEVHRGLRVRPAGARAVVVDLPEHEERGLGFVRAGLGIDEHGARERELLLPLRLAALRPRRLRLRAGGMRRERAIGSDGGGTRAMRARGGREAAGFQHFGGCFAIGHSRRRFDRIAHLGLRVLVTALPDHLERLGARQDVVRVVDGHVEPVLVRLPSRHAPQHAEHHRGGPRPRLSRFGAGSGEGTRRGSPSGLFSRVRCARLPIEG